MKMIWSRRNFYIFKNKFARPGLVLRSVVAGLEGFTQAKERSQDRPRGGGGTERVSH